MLVDGVVIKVTWSSGKRGVGRVEVEVESQVGDLQIVL